ESETSSALKQVQDSGAARYIEDRLPRAYRTREQRAVNNNFPFSSHDNRHCLQNAGEYFDFVST
ncbi:Testis-expressed sequence 36 protein, partial [Buceros rhinoceros silvestris]